MFHLRFLIGSPRKVSYHVFCHREYRGQRTKPDDFHPAFNTYICEAKGDPGTPGYKSSYDVQMELLQHAAANQASAQLFPIVEVYNPDTRERLKLAGDEIILRPSDLAAAQTAFNATQPIASAVDIIDMPVDEVIATYGHEPANNVNPVPESPPLPVSAEGVSQPPAQPSVLDRVRAEIQTNGKATATQLANTLGISASAIKDAVGLENSGLQNRGGWISLIPVS